MLHNLAQEYSDDGVSQTIRTVDPLYQKVIGQQLTTSFYDRKLLNLAYCSGMHAYKRGPAFILSK